MILSNAASNIGIDLSGCRVSPVRRVFVLFAVLLAVTGCAGKEFTRIPNADLVFNQTEASEIQAKLGDPQNTMMTLVNGKEIRTWIYSYASAVSTAGLVAGGASSRVQVFKFHQGKLVGYEYSSSFLNDPTGFDSSVIAGFREGVTTRADVVQVLGEPGGESVYPVIDQPGDRAVTYAFTLTDANLRSSYKSLTVVFGPDDVAKAITFVDSKPI